MKFLSLYIDKYYIVGSVVSAETNDNGSLNLCGVAPLRLSNSEDRIWLYFYEDTAVDEITFGLSNKIHCDNREVHYIEGSVFDNIVNKYSTYTLRGISKEMKFIFQDSKIFDALKNSIDEETPEVYLSFSNEISISAQYEFVKLLEDNGFDVKQYVACIEKLAFEKKKKDDRVVLVMSACNENLHFKLYNGDSISEKRILGKGLDLRQKALVSIAVNNINKSAHVLTTKDDCDYEILRLMPSAETWLKRLDSSKIPVKIDISFAIDPNTIYSPQLKKSDVENFSKDLIRELTDVIHSFVSSNGIKDYELQKIIYIGDLFNNKLLRDSIAHSYQCTKELIPISELPSIVSHYTQIDCSMFNDVISEFKPKAEAELLQKHLDQDRYVNEIEKTNKREKEREDTKKRAEKRKAFEKLKNQYKDSARDCRWQDAIDYARKAKQELDDKSPDYSTEISYIDVDIEDFQSKLSEQKVRFEIFKKEIKLAREFFNENLWQEAISHSEKALDYNADDVEAKRIISESRLKLDNKDKIKDFVTRATMLLGQKNFEEALEEVESGLILEAANDELLSLKNEIRLKEKDFDDNVNELSDKLDDAISEENYDSALDLIAKLIELDNYHSSKWFDKKNDVRELIKGKELFNNKLKILKSDIEFAYNSKQWDKVLSLASDYLSNKEDQEVSKIKREAEIKIEELKQTNLIVDLYGEIETLITEAKYSIAEKKVKFLQNEYSEERERCKKLLAKIFDLEDEEDRKIRDKNRRSEDKSDSDDFFNEKPKKKTKVNTDSYDDDFFNEKPQKRVNVKKNSSDDDFDF